MWVCSSALARDRVDFRLYLVGSRPLREDLVDSTALGLPDRVKFVGYVAAQSPEWFWAADMTVLPSHSDVNVLLDQSRRAHRSSHRESAASGRSPIR